MSTDGITRRGFVESVGAAAGASTLLGAPAIVVVVLLDFGLAVINRIAPQVQVFFLGMTVKGTLGILVVLLALGMTFELIVDQFGDLLQRRVDVMRFGGAHRLHRNRMLAADPDVANHQLTRGTPRGKRRRRRLRCAGHAQADRPGTHWNSLIGLTRSAVTVSSM